MLSFGGFTRRGLAIQLKERLRVLFHIFSQQQPIGLENHFHVLQPPNEYESGNQENQESIFLTADYTDDTDIYARVDLRCEMSDVRHGEWSRRGASDIDGLSRVAETRGSA